MASEVSQQVSSNSSALSPPDVIDIPAPDDALNSDLHISPENSDVGVNEKLQHQNDTMDVQDMPIVSPLHDAVSTSTFAVPENQIFLDICAGSTRPLSQAVLSLGGDVLAFDILLDSSMDLLRDDSYEQLLRICSSGQVRYGSASPACAHYSRLKLLPGPGPRALRTPEALHGVPGLSSQELFAGARIIHDAFSLHYLSDIDFSGRGTRAFGTATFGYELARRLRCAIFEIDISLVCGDGSMCLQC